LIVMRAWLTRIPAWRLACSSPDRRWWSAWPWHRGLLPGALVACVAACLGICGPAWAGAGEPSPQAAVDGPALAPEQAAYLTQLQQQAAARRLAQDPMWHKLLHYHRHPLWRQLRSLADDPGFFNSPRGGTDPDAELAATLAAFFDPRERHAGSQAAQCRFAARYAWLHERLQFDAARLPPQRCERLEQWRKGLDVARVTLVFPTAYINSPASMYGHTFLRLDPHGATGDQPLLSYAISYAAAGNETDGLMFAFRGVFGLYPGIFTNWPYYLHIRDYTHLENRDIWEYELNLDEAQIGRLVLHAWELGFTRFDYYFFDENCSYHLLSLIDVAREDLDFSSQFLWWAIPVDTVRAIADTPGLLRAQRYRPSNSTQLRAQAEQLPADMVDWARDLAEARRSPPDLVTGPYPPEQQARILELAERYLTFRGATGKQVGEEAQRNRGALLAARARLPQTPPVDVPVPKVPPQAGHGTARVDLEAGRRDGQASWQLSWRTAYHDLMDPEPGYSRGAHLRFARTEFVQQQGHGIRLERFVPVDIISLTPRERLVDGSSWKVRFGLQRTWPRAGRAADAVPALAFEVNGGPGYAFELGDSKRALAYALVDNQLWYDPALDDRRWALGTGLQLGLLWDPLPRWRVHLQGYRRALLGPAPQESGWSVQQRIALDARYNLTLNCDRQERDGELPRRSCAAGLQRYW
jgi:hypothetical protein